MVRVITQETYNEVVNENIEDLDMTPEEAVKDAVAQFTAQGVDLSNIIKDLVLGSGDVTNTIATLQKLTDKADSDDELMIKELNDLKSECEKDIARRVRAGKAGAYDLLIKLLEGRHKIYLNDKKEKDAAFIVSVLNTLSALMDVQPDLLEIKGLEMIKIILDKIKHEDILLATLRWINVCCSKHEMNRQNIFGANIADNIKDLLKVRNNKMLSETLRLVRKLTQDDDIRVEFGKAHEHAKELGVQLLELLTDLLKEHTRPPLVSELLLTVSSLLVRDELCASMSPSVDHLISILTDNYDNVAVVTQCYRTITALAGNDDVKRKLISCGMAPIIVSTLTRHAGNAPSSSLALKCMSALSLREPEHGRQLMHSGAAEAIVDCMKRHPDDASVQKNGCWAIRNMVARCRDENAKFHELGVESLLNQAYDKFASDFGFDIKSALRDLECDVKLDEQWTGKGVQMEK